MVEAFKINESCMMKKLCVYIRWLVLLNFGILTGCSALKPPLQEINETKGRNVVLVVEDNHKYETPVEMDPVNLVNPLLTIVGGLAAMHIQNKYDELHKQLTKQGQDLNLLEPEKSAHTHFINLLQSRLKELGLSVEVRPTPFELFGFGSSGRSYTYPSSKSPISPQELAYGLRIDMGNCSLKRTIPCIRYVLSKLSKSNDNSEVKSFFRYGKTYPHVPTKAALQENLPGYSSELPQTDDDIQSFDRVLHQLVEHAVIKLMNDIKGVNEAKAAF